MTMNCLICGSLADASISGGFAFVMCPTCGRFEYSSIVPELEGFNLNHLGSYLFYNGFNRDLLNEYRYYTTLSAEKCDELKQDYINGNIEHGHPVHLSQDNVEAWYPKNISEKVDYILLYLSQHTTYMGEQLKFANEEVCSWLFVDRYNYSMSQKCLIHHAGIKIQTEFMINFLIQNELISKRVSSTGGLLYALTPQGYTRIDELQKNTAKGRKVLVAMKFGKDTTILRSAIRKGITDADYHAVFIDEVEHNEFITPELLKHIKDSKFIVVDLTHQNNGAYFEEGYAMGLGKTVIQLCQKDVKLHFDIAQKNSILWETEDEVPERLKKRILASID